MEDVKFDCCKYLVSLYGNFDILGDHRIRLVVWRINEVCLQIWWENFLIIYIHTLYYSFITIEEVRCGLFQEKEKEKLV